MALPGWLSRENEATQAYYKSSSQMMEDAFRELRHTTKDDRKIQLQCILTAIEEVIREHRNNSIAKIKSITATEYFAALMQAMDSANNSHATEVITLLSMVLPQVPVAVLRLKYSAVAKVLLRMVKEEPTKQAVSVIGVLLTAQETSKAVWSRPDVLKLFHLLLQFSTDAKPKFRKAAQHELTQLLQKHREGNFDTLSSHITVFSKKVLSACRADDDKKAMQLLSFLKVALPLLRSKFVDGIIAPMFRLLSLDDKTLALVTLQTLNALVLDTSSELSQRALQELIEKLVATDLWTQDLEITSLVIRTLTMAQIRRSEQGQHALLHRVFMALCSYFSGPKPELHTMASKQMINLVTKCLTPQVIVETQEILHHMVRSIESLLTLRYQQAWRFIVPAISQIFRHFGTAASPHLNKVLLTLVELYESIRNMPEAPKGAEQFFGDAMGAAVASYGSEEFLKLVPLVPQGETIFPDSRTWLIPILRDNMKQSPNRLSVFSAVVLETARACEAESRQKGLPMVNRKQLQDKTMLLWSLFPSFCHQVGDISTELKPIAKTLATGLSDRRFPELRTIVCTGFQVLIRQVDEQKNQQDKQVLCKYAKRYLPILITSLESMDDANDAAIPILVETIRGFATMADSDITNGLFRQLVQKLLEASTASKNNPEAGSQDKLRSHLHMSAVLAFVQMLDDDSVALLYRLVKPYLLDDTDTVMQKRAYGVLVSICKHHPNFMLESQTLKNLVEVMCESLLTCSAPAKKLRLKCLNSVVSAMRETNQVDMELLPSLVGEIILCTKESNAKARNAAFELLISVCHLLDASGPEGLTMMFQMVLGGLAGKTPHMRSAAVVSLSRLIFEFGKTSPQVSNMMPDLLSTIMLLLHEKAREVIKSVIGFIKLAIAIIPQEQLKTFLPDMLQGLLLWIGESKNRFRAKIRIILIKLCRKYGYDEIMQLVPEKDRKLITHIKKEKERTDRQKAANINDKTSFDRAMDDDDDDEDDEMDQDETHHNIREGSEEIMDFLDQSAIRNLVTKRTGEAMEEDDTEFDVSKDGRIIIPDDNETTTEMTDKEADEETLREDLMKEMQKMGMKTAGKRKRDDNGGAGKEYKAKKAGGDVKKKGAFEPYAYIPLDPKLMAKRNKRQAVKRYSSVVQRKGKK